MCGDAASGTQAISGATNLDELVTRHPHVAQVFIRRKMQCVGCEVARFETLAIACDIYGQPLDTVLAELRQAICQCHGSADRQS